MVMTAHYNLKLEVQKQKRQGLENYRESMEVKRQSSSKGKSRAAQPKIQVGGRKRNNHNKIHIQNTSVLFLDKQQIFCCVPWSPDFCTAIRK